MQVCLIEVPYMIGDDRQGGSKGPGRLIEAALAGLRPEERLGADVAVERVGRGVPFRDSVSASTAVNRNLASAVRRALAAKQFPLVVAGSCDASMGVVAGIEHENCGVVWFDAHGDFNTPETTISGFFGGMSLAVITGHCYRSLWAQIADRAPVAEAATLILGVRDLDPAERGRWLADQTVLFVLCRLHTLLQGQIEEADDATFFHPMWSSDMNYAAVSLLPSEKRTETLSRLEAIKGRADDLFQRMCLVSGDPNPTNWGLLPDGTPVLFDWERFGLGTPALDLAITVPGLGDMMSYLVVADVYLACRPVDEAPVPLCGTVNELAKVIACAKVWGVAEYLSAFVRSVGVQPVVGALRAVNSIAVRLPEWLASLG